MIVIVRLSQVDCHTSLLERCCKLCGVCDGRRIFSLELKGVAMKLRMTGLSVNDKTFQAQSPAQTALMAETVETTKVNKEASLSNVISVELTSSISVAMTFSYLPPKVRLSFHDMPQLEIL